MACSGVRGQGDRRDNRPEAPGNQDWEAGATVDAAADTTAAVKLRWCTTNSTPHWNRDVAFSVVLLYRGAKSLVGC